MTTLETRMIIFENTVSFIPSLSCNQLTKTINVKLSDKTGEVGSFEVAIHTEIFVLEKFPSDDYCSSVSIPRHRTRNTSVYDSPKFGREF